MEANPTGKTKTVLGLITDDVEFLVAGREPFGKAEFAAISRFMQGVGSRARLISATSRWWGTWYLGNHLDVTHTPPGDTA